MADDFAAAREREEAARRAKMQAWVRLMAANEAYEAARVGLDLARKEYEAAAIQATRLAEERDGR